MSGARATTCGYDGMPCGDYTKAARLLYQGNNISSLSAAGVRISHSTGSGITPWAAVCRQYPPTWSRNSNSMDISL